MRYFIKLAYNGARYHGWQAQPNALSVQQSIERALGVLFREPSVPIVGAGRTDAGVNARVMYAHFDVDFPIGNIPAHIRSLNSLLGRDIVVYDLIPVAADAHARFDATQRTYKYFVTTHPSPFKYQFAWLCHAPLDFDSMNSAAQLLLTTCDFTSFSKLHTDVKTNICHVTEARWDSCIGSHGDYVFTISANRFLRNMVHAVVGTLIDVGRGKITESRFKEVINQKNRCEAGTSMPAHALFLWDIKYPYI